MADDRKVVITLQSKDIPSNGGTNDQVVNTSDKTEKAQATNSTNAQGSDSSDSLAALSVISTNFFNQAKNQTWEIINYEIQKHNQLTDNYRGQETLSRAKNAASFGIQLVSNLGRTTAMYGPWGILIGAVEDAGMIAMKGIQYGQQLEQQTIQIKQSEMQVSFGRQMIGYSLIDESVGTNR